MPFLGSWCAQCGPDVSVDEDGCCNACGCSAVGEGADAAHTTIADLRDRVRVLEEALGPLARASLSSSVGPVYVIGSRMGAPYDRNAAKAAVQRARAALAKGGE